MATAQKTNDATPTEWPGAFGIYNRSQKAVLTNIGTLALLFLTYIVAVIVFAILFNNSSLEDMLANIVSIILGPIFTLVLLQGIDGKKIAFTDAIKRGLPLLVQYFLVSILVGLALIGSLLALLIPFVFVLPRLILAEYYVVDKKMDAIAAFKASWNETKGHSTKVWGVIGASIVMLLPIFTIIGIPVAIFLIIMYSAAFGILYRYITSHKSAA